MFQALLICFREGLEAFLIVAIAALFLRKAHNHALLGALRWGVLTALAACTVLGVVLAALVGAVGLSTLATQQLMRTQLALKNADNAQTLALASKVRALLDGRYNVSFEDARRVLLPGMRHRIIVNFEAQAEGIEPDQVLLELLEKVPEKDEG